MANKSPSLFANPGLVLVITYFILFAVNSLVLYLAHLWFPHHVVLGTQSLTPIWALILSMGTLTLLDTFAIPFINHYEKVRAQTLTTKDWMLAYFALNFVGVWLVTRFADNLGFGITSWIVAAILAVALDFTQGAAMMQLEKLRTRS